MEGADERSRELEDAGEEAEYNPEEDEDVDISKIWKTHSKGDHYFYNLVDIYTGFLVTEIVNTKNENVIAKATTKPERIFDFGSSNQFLDKYLEKFDILIFFIIKKLPHRGGKIPCGSKIFFKVFNSFTLFPKANLISFS